MLLCNNHKDRTKDLCVCVCVFWGWENMKGRFESTIF